MHRGKMIKTTNLILEVGKMKNAFWAVGMAWMATSAAVIAGIYITKSANCLWALLLPAMLRTSNRKE